MIQRSARRAACEAGVPHYRPTHQGCHGGARKQRSIHALVSNIVSGVHDQDIIAIAET